MRHGLRMIGFGNNGLNILLAHIITIDIYRCLRGLFFQTVCPLMMAVFIKLKGALGPASPSTTRLNNHLCPLRL
jgi:hypothetical protein